MPSFSKTIRLALLCAAGVGVLFALDIAARNRRQASAVADLRTWTTDADCIEAAFSNGETRVFQRSGDSWNISAPAPSPAEATQVQALLDAISGTTRIRRIPSREIALRKLTPADFGLDAPIATLSVRDSHGTTHSIAFGATPPAATNEVFTDIAGEDGYSVLDTHALDLLSRPLVDFSDRRLCRTALRDVSLISVERPGGEPMRLIRSQDRDSWQISSPFSLPADWGEMKKFTEALSQTRIVSLLYGEEAIQPESASLVIRLFAGKSPFPAVIAIGSEMRDGLFSAIAEGGVAATVTADAAHALSITPNSIRDRRIFLSGPTLEVTALTLTTGGEEAQGRLLTLGRTQTGDWELTSPVSAPADQETISHLLAEILSLKAAGFSQSPTNAPAISLQITTPDATNRLDYSFGESSAAIVLDASPVAALAPTNALETLRAVAANPALAISRSLGSFPLREVLSIDIVRDDGSSQRFDIAPDGSMSIGGDDASTEPISDPAEISSRISAMARFLAFVQADAAVLPSQPSLALDHPIGAATPDSRALSRIYLTVEPRNPQVQPLTLRFASPDPDTGTVLAKISDAPGAPAFIFPASIYEIFARNFRESYHAAEEQ